MNDVLEQYDNTIRMVVGQWVRRRSWRLKSDYEDLVQECRLRVWQKSHYIDANRFPKAYIRKICHEACRQYAQELESDILGYAVQLPEDEDKDEEYD
jgi:DNA-directed RNA polymerase specialized sigma24 family protein